MSKILDRILKLFALGGANSHTSEAEMLAAVTKARQLMIQHKVSEAEVQAALDAKTKTHAAPKVDISEHTAYTRKIRSLARYDSILAVAVATLTDTEAMLRYLKAWNGNYCSMSFVGQPADVAVASAVFMIWLPEIRRRARNVYGSAAWNKLHTSYAVGYATRVLDRAREAQPLPSEAQTYALVLSRTKEAIGAYIEKQKTESALRQQEQGLKSQVPKSREPQIVPGAFNRGYVDGEAFALDTKGLK